MNRKCQVFTPTNYVAELLDNVGYTENLYGKKILENSCGDGNILEVIVRRYIDDCSEHGLTRTKIKNGLARDICGVEIDTEQYDKCIDRLNRILVEKNIKQVNWNITNEDYLKKEDSAQYEFIVGNPPYITYKEMKKADQVYLKKDFSSCQKGKFDYCYAFIEKSIASLSMDGRMAYLIPSSIFKTVFGAGLRNCMKPYIDEIFDYTQDKMFDDALVKSAIMLLKKNKSDTVLRYIDMTTNINKFLPIGKLGSKWFFTENMGRDGRRFGDYFKVSHAVATLLNEAYVMKEGEYLEAETYFVYRNHRIEKAIVRDTATPRSLRYGKTEKLIFPYFYENGSLGRYTEEEFSARFPEGTAYLGSYREKLDKRQCGENVQWFEYGRSQALANLNAEKLLISTVVTTDVAVYRLGDRCIPYAGMYIVPREGNTELTIDEAMDILRQRDFMQYVLDVGIHISGSSLRITSKDIEDYRF